MSPGHIFLGNSVHRWVKLSLSSLSRTCGFAHVLASLVTEADYTNALDYLRLGRYPKVFTKNERHALRHKAAFFRVKSRVLYHYDGRGLAAGSW